MPSKFTFLTFFFISLLSNSLKCQDSCDYVEHEPISKGKICTLDTLYFTNSVQTQIKGEISANKVIIIKPHGLYAIIIKAGDESCQKCANGNEGNTTIKTKDRTGGGKNKKTINPNTTEVLENKIVLKKNPLKDILDFSLPENITISSYQIYSSLGKNIKTSASINKNHQINVSHLPSGKYWITIYTNENKTYTLTFIKN